MEKIVFWNNKGGTGKTSLVFQTICDYAHSNKSEKILAVDMCPQCNLSEMMLGGLQGKGSDNLLMRQGQTPRATVGGYFQMRLSSPITPPEFTANNFITYPNRDNYNNSIPSNVDLVCGDPLLELQSNALSTLANTNVPGENYWIGVIDWLKDFFDKVHDVYDVVFIDTNPSFSIYTQIAISTADKVILPVMADDSSRRAIQNAISLIYGLKLPSEIYTKYAFAEKLKEVNRRLPKIHLIVKNRITQYMGAASAYATVLEKIGNDIIGLCTDNPHIFTFTDKEANNHIIEVRDFQTAGVVAHARACPFYCLSCGRLDILGRRVQVDKERKEKCAEDIAKITAAL
ncbi:MAG TPA: ATPase [Ruminococcaceae bacterium]|nr:ATPase [Oscillospiraceae bacterium]